MTHLAFDLRTTHYSGIYRYGISLLHALDVDEIDRDCRLTVIAWPERSGEIVDDLENPRLTRRLRLVEVPDDGGFIRDSPWLRDWLIKEEVDLYYSIHYIVDSLLPVPYVFTIYDLIRIKYPDLSPYTDAVFQAKFGREEFEQMREAYQRLDPDIRDLREVPEDKKVFHRYFWSANWRLANQCAGVVSVSHTVKKDIMHLLGIPGEKIEVVPGAVDGCLFNRYRNSESTSGVLAQYGLKLPFFLFVGLAHKHKRLDWLFAVFAQLKAEKGLCPPLVMVGDHRDYQGELERLVVANSLGTQVRFLGRINDIELVNLYHSATALVISSVDEGFCLPAVEALACGTEVIVPDIPIMNEVVGEQGRYYGLDDADSLMRLLAEAYTTGFPPRLTPVQLRFSWTTSARRLMRFLWETADRISRTASR